MDQDSRILIDYLQGLLRRAVVHWSSHHVSADEPWTTDWVDIRISDRGAPPFNWAWTIIAEDDPQSTSRGQLWQFAWPYDVTVHRVLDPVMRPSHISTTARGVPLPESRVHEYRVLARASGGSYDVRGGWTVETIGQALSHWAATHAARRDLRFEWESEGEPYPALKQAMERLRATDEGAPVWALGDGLAVVDGFHDELLAMDPDEREALLGWLREVGHSSFGDGEPELPASSGPQPTDRRRGRRSRAAPA